MIKTEYDISAYTMAIIPLANEKYGSKVLDLMEGIIFLEERPIALIERGCLEGGATYKGRRHAMVKQLGYVQKCPIPILPQENIFAFPSMSPCHFECIWIFPNHIKSKKELINQVHVTLKNDEEIVIPISMHTFTLQVNRTWSCMVQFGKLLN